MAGEYPLLESSFLSSPVVDLDGYPYFVNPVSDGIPCMTRELLDEVVDGIVSVADLDCDIVLTPEAMGIPLAACITERTGIPYSVIRKRRYGLPGEISLDQRTGYSHSPMYVNGVGPGTRVYSKQRDLSGLSAELGVPVRCLLAVSSSGGVPCLL